MNLQQILDILNTANCSDYIVNETNAYNTEMFVIDSKVDMTRVKTNTSYSVTVFVDTINGETKFRGSASTIIAVTASIEEAKKAIDDCCLAASYIKDRYYGMPEKLMSVNMAEGGDDHEARLKQVADALLNVKCKENEKINSFEVFVKDTEIHMVTSSGSDVRYHNKENQIEVIVNVGNEEHEIEIYYDDTFTLKSTEELTKDIEVQLQRGQDRMNAKPNNVVCDNIIISDKNVDGFGNYYAFKTNVQALYMGAVATKIGDSVYREEVLGDKITYKTYRNLDGAGNNAPCDGVGLASKDAVILEDGVCRNYIGSYRFGYYLNQACLPTIHTEFCGGKYTEAELKKEPYLECVEFSDFQVDSFTGNFAGELRLGYYFDGETITPVSGGSISGQLSKLEKELYFSKETVRYNNHVMPKCVLIKHASIAHVE
ncbi:MAG: hypothetical protein IKM20_01530 [Erysipelotrichales bacterium]|nr:hypothetical protein [Erysipelotrichales bacterium]